jgi:hypothetical protein
MDHPSTFFTIQLGPFYFLVQNWIELRPDPYRDRSLNFLVQNEGPVRQVEGEEESAAATSMMMQTNKGFLQWREAASEVIRRVTWCWCATLPPPMACDNHQCVGRLCFKKSWEEWSHFCNEECRIHTECDLFFRKIIGYLHPNKLNPDMWEWFWIYFVSRSIHWYLLCFYLSSLFLM